MRKDDWVKAAMTDDRMVGELLMRLNNHHHHHHHHRYSSASPPADKNLDLEFNNNNNPLINWGIRKPRSRPIPVLRWINNNHHHHNTVVVHRRQAKKEADSTIASPKTPLLWSPGTSLSGGAGSGGSGDFFEESSRPSINNARSNKVTTTTGTDIRRSRKRKEFADLKENESFLLKEKIHIKKSQLSKEISSSCGASVKASSNNDRFRNTQEYIDETPKIFRTSGKVYDSKSCEAEKVAVATQKSLFVLPDLNVPLEDTGSMEVLYGWS